MSKTKEEILKKHLDKHNVEIAKMYVQYLYDAMDEYGNQEYKAGYQDGCREAANDISSRI